MNSQRTGKLYVSGVGEVGWHTSPSQTALASYYIFELTPQEPVPTSCYEISAFDGTGSKDKRTSYHLPPSLRDLFDLMARRIFYGSHRAKGQLTYNLKAGQLTFTIRSEEHTSE